VNLALVPDGGEAVGSAGDQQDDPRFGDIRIGAVPLPAGTLAVTFLPPPANGGTDAGDILLNSNINWQIGSSYDLATVMAHEFGHALGLGDVSSPAPPNQPVMYGTYSGINTTLTSDDVAGIQSVYGAPQFDSYNQNGNRNITYMTASNISSNIGANGQAAIPNLDITTAGQSEWFYVTVPATQTGKMTVTVQSTNLSSLSPKLQVYTSALGLVGTAGTVNSMAATISVSTSVSAGQGYYIKVLAAGGYGAMGSYGLLVNVGSQSQSPIAPPYTVVAQQPDQGSSGSLTNAVSIIQPGNPPVPGAVFTTIGTLGGWADDRAAGDLGPEPYRSANRGDRTAGRARHGHDDAGSGHGPDQPPPPPGTRSEADPGDVRASAQPCERPRQAEARTHRLIRGERYARPARVAAGRARAAPKQPGEVAWLPNA
jgi:hypothetical protein